LEISTEQLLEVVAAMKSNSTVKYFSIANTRANDEVAKGTFHSTFFHPTTLEHSMYFIFSLRRNAW